MNVLGEAIKGFPIPKWEGTFSFDKCHNDVRAVLEDAPIMGQSTAPEWQNEPFETSSGVTGVNLAAWMAMGQARPIFIGEEQVLALPNELPTDYVETARAPFKSTYFDFSTVRGPARVPFGMDGDDSDPGEYHLEMPGALVVQYATRKEYIETFGPDYAYDESTSPFGAGLSVIPFGSRFFVNGNPAHLKEEGIMPPYAPMGMVSFELHTQKPVLFSGVAQQPKENGTIEPVPLAFIGIRYPMNEFGFPGTVTFGAAQQIRRLVNLDNGEDPEDTSRDMQAEVDGFKDLNLVLKDHPEMLDTIRAEAGIITHMSFLALRAMYLLDAANVSLEDAPLSRQVRRNAERKNIGISKVVRVYRSSKREPKVTHQTVSGKDFSHRFERRGHYNHVTKGPQFKKDYIKLCSRRDPKTGELTCPDGCRRVWIPDTVVGPEDKPFIPKTRIWPGKDHVRKETS